MNAKRYLATPLLIMLLLTAGAAPPQAPALVPYTAYIEPILFSLEAETLSVIVIANDSQAAARAVERVGGQVTSDLWLIDAVAATIPATQLEALATTLGVRSIVSNKGVQTADGPTGWDGWVTDWCEKKDTFDLVGEQYTPAVFLPDGGFVSVADPGTSQYYCSVLIVNADGSVRAQVGLPAVMLRTTPVVGADGTTYLNDIGEPMVYALNPDGSTLTL